jgi:hypothetical protein
MSDINTVLKNLDWNHRRPFGWNSSPDADWKVIFFGALILILIVSALNLWLFIEAQSGNLFINQEEVVSEMPSLDLEKLRATLTHYEDKAAESQRLLDGSALIIGDPSI